MHIITQLQRDFADLPHISKYPKPPKPPLQSSNICNCVDFQGERWMWGDGQAEFWGRGLASAGAGARYSPWLWPRSRLGPRPSLWPKLWLWARPQLWLWPLTFAATSASSSTFDNSNYLNGPRPRPRLRPKPRPRSPAKALALASALAFALTSAT